MELNTRFTLCSALVTVLFANAGDAIKCFECNSQNNSMCLNPLMYDKATIDKYKLHRDCNTGVSGKKEFFCRKMTQTILRHGLEAEVRITRGCGWVRNFKNRDCYKADNDDHLEIVCQCFSDQCNGSDNPNRINLYTLSLAILAVLGMKKFCLLRS